MKRKHAPPSFMVPLTIGRSEAYFTANDKAEQLELFRTTMTRPIKVQVLAMMGLSDPTMLDRPQAAKIADIAETMGSPRNPKTGTFHPTLYSDIESAGMELLTKSIALWEREQVGTDRTGRPKYRTVVIVTSMLQEFGFYYEDEDGHPIDLTALPPDEKEGLIEVRKVGNKALYAIPKLDDAGHPVLDEDGKPLRRQANGVQWRWSSRIADLTKQKGTSWVAYLEAVHILQKYLAKPVVFDLIWLTLFYDARNPFIEWGFDKLVHHFGIKSKDRAQVKKAIDDAFQIALDEGIIVAMPTVREAGYYKPKKEGGHARRKSEVYQWRRAAKWTVGSFVEVVEEVPSELKTEGHKE